MRQMLILATVLAVGGCVLFSPRPAHFEAKQIETSYFSIAVWEKETIRKKEPLRIYFEGDGNPNPAHKVALYFAEQDPSSNVIYVARPCQWVDEPICRQKPEIYGNARFHYEIMSEMQELVTYLVRKYQAPSVELVGYDGGAVIALNIATKVPTKRVITIAGITDVVAYTNYHNLPQMDEEDTANPADNLAALAEIPQIHYVGKEDDITPRRLVERFVARLHNPKSAVVKVVPSTGHTDWEGVKLDY